MSTVSAPTQPLGVSVQTTGPITQSGRPEQNSFFLRLANFRRIPYFETRIPASGLVLLDGPTGVGKTALLEAISFVLYDNAGNSCYNRKDRSNKKHEPTWVELTFPKSGWRGIPPGLVILRQRRPNLLRVVGEGILLEDGKAPAAAQGYLDRLFGQYAIWKVGGYIRQDSICDFFTMSPAEKLALLQQLSLPDRVDPKSGRVVSGAEQFETYLGRTVEKINAMLTQVREADMQVKICAEIYMRHYNQWAPGLQGKAAWTPEVLSSQFATYKETYTLDSLPQDLNRLLTKVRSENLRRRKQLEIEIAQEQMKLVRVREGIKQRRQLEAMKLNLQTELLALPDTKEEIARLEREQTEITEQIVLAQKSERRSQLLAAKAEIQRRLDSIPNENSKYTLSDLDSFDRLLAGPTPSQLDDQINEVVQTIEYLGKLALYNRRQALLSQIAVLEEQLNSYPKNSFADEIEAIGKKIWSLSLQEKKLVCPKCSSHLYLNGNQLTELTLSDHVHGESIEQLTQKKGELQRQEALFQQRSHLDRQLSQLKTDLTTFDSNNDLTGFSPQTKPKLSHLAQHQLEHLMADLQRTKKLRIAVPTDLNTAEERRKIQSAQDRARLLRDIEQVSREIDAVPAGGAPAEIGPLESRRKEVQSRIQLLRQQEVKRVSVQAQLSQIEAQLKLIIDQQSGLRSGRSSPSDFAKTKLSSSESSSDFEPDESVLESLKKELETVVNESQTLEAEIGFQIQFAQLADLARQHTRAQENYQKLHQRLAALQRIKASLIMAEYILLDAFLSRINQSLATVIEQLFVQPASFTLRSMRQLKTDDRIKPQINYEIVIDGVESSNISEVSGGERSRISLALAIVFSSFTNAPFLLLDESLSTLNAAIKETTMKVIRHYLSDKVVIAVNHDTTTGVYDTVVRLG